VDRGIVTPKEREKIMVTTTFNKFVSSKYRAEVAGQYYGDVKIEVDTGEIWDCQIVRISKDPDGDPLVVITMKPHGTGELFAETIVSITGQMEE
jgi:hypothetical protein